LRWLRRRRTVGAGENGDLCEAGSR